MKLSWYSLSAKLYLLLPLAMSGCATSSYMGIGFAPGAADPVLQQLAQRARSGEKQAQYSLGEAFEFGSLTSLNLRQACVAYQLAGAFSPKAKLLYARTPGAAVPGLLISGKKWLPNLSMELAKKKRDNILSKENARSCDEIR